MHKTHHSRRFQSKDKKCKTATNSRQTGKYKISISQNRNSQIEDWWTFTWMVLLDCMHAGKYATHCFGCLACLLACCGWVNTTKRRQRSIANGSPIIDRATRLALPHTLSDSAPRFALSTVQSSAHVSDRMYTRCRRDRIERKTHTFTIQYAVIDCRDLLSYCWSWGGLINFGRACLGRSDSST